MDESKKKDEEKLDLSQAQESQTEADNGKKEEKFVLKIDEKEFADFGEIEPLDTSREAEDAEKTQMIDLNELKQPRPDEKEKPENRQKTQVMDAVPRETPIYLEQEAVKPERKWLKLLLKIFAALLILAFCALTSLGIIYASGDIFGLGESELPIVVDIEQNSSITEIAELLKEKGVIKYPFVFRAYIKFEAKDTSFKFGTFTLHPSMPYGDIISMLSQSGVSDATPSITIVEGERAVDIAQKLEEKKICSAESFLNEVKKGNYSEEFSFLKDLPDSGRLFQLEGYLFPDTHNFYQNTDAEEVVNRLLGNFEAKFTDEMMARVDELGVSLDQLITLASIIQAEAPNSSQMKMVSSVYWNRLNNSKEFKRMQSDPTKNYASLLLEYGASEEIAESYNTYSSHGLPPGAINNPGLDAIMAALYPEESNYYYFCTNLETGEFFYASDYATHQQNLAKAGLSE